MGNAILVRKGGIDVSDATAVSHKVLSGSSFFAGENDDIQEGTMPNRGAVYKVLNAGEFYRIPEGYHNGIGKVGTTSLLSQTQATATPTQILSGQTAYVNGEKVTGTMPNRGANNIVLPVNGTATIPEGYHNGQGRVSQNLVTQGAYTNAISSVGVNPAYIRIPQGYYGTNTVSGYPEIVYSLDMARSSGYALQSEVDHWRNSYYGMEQDRNNWVNVANSRYVQGKYTLSSLSTEHCNSDIYFFRSYAITLPITKFISCNVSAEVVFSGATMNGYTFNFKTGGVYYKVDSNKNVFAYTGYNGTYSHRAYLESENLFVGNNQLKLCIFSYYGGCPSVASSCEFKNIIIDYIGI